MTKSVLVLLALLVSTTSYAIEWSTSTFTTALDLVNLGDLSRNPAMVLKGTVEISKDRKFGHIIVNGNAYPCVHITKSALTSDRLVQYVCPIMWLDFVEIVRKEAIQESAFESAMIVLERFANANYKMAFIMPVAFEAAGPERRSPYYREYLDPGLKKARVDASFSISGLSE